MNKSYVEQKIDVQLLDLDSNNPRFLDFFDNNSTEDDIIQHLLENEKAIDIVEEINKVQDFYTDSQLWVLQKNGRYIVKEGNRRLASVKALANPLKYLKNKYPKIKINELPCLVYNDEKTLDERLIRRHTQGEIEKWSRLALTSTQKTPLFKT